MINKLKELLHNDPKLRLILVAGLIIQVVVAITATGSYHPDQHFQIIEFSSYQTGTPNSAASIWEFNHPIRPTLQVYLFSGWHYLMGSIGINNPYTELTILRIIVGLLMFGLFNLIAIYYFKNEQKKVLYSVLLILNFSWFLPYVKVQFSSEMMSALFFFGTAWLYDIKKDKSPGIAFLVLIGFLFSLSFYFRFQTGFLLAGFGIWLIWIAKKAKHILPFIAGFIIGIVLNTWLDHEFYHRLIITPYEYYYSNIVEKRAASFGTSSFLRYIGLFVAVVSVPPISIFLFYYAVKGFFKNYRHLLFITTMFFIIAHCIVGHKEERFMFSILFVLPVWIGWGLPSFFSYYSSCKKVFRYCIKGVLIFSVTLNCLLLLLLILNPYSQSIHFTGLLEKKLNKQGTLNRVYCFKRTPFETPGKSQYVFYQRYFKNTEITRVDNSDSLKLLQGNDIYLAATFDDILNDRKTIDSLGYKPVFYSSGLLWKINEFLYSKKLHPVNDIWVLYKKQ
jgi:phosphatidylinositol glycan class B